MTQRPQPVRELDMALRAPPQRTLRITTLAIIREPIQILEHPSIRINDPPATPATTTHTPLKHLTGTEIRNPSPDCRRPDPGRADHRLRPAVTKRDRLRRRPQPPRALIQMGGQQAKALHHTALVDHAPSIRRPRQPPSRSSTNYCQALGGAEVLDAARLERDWGGDQPQSVGAQVWATCRLLTFLNAAK
jgi:hypothetical protein